jgi:hypothetical protein
MDIACLGWGSLVWDKRSLPLKPSNPPRWHRDGPELPIEFARHSSRERITLVIGPMESTDPMPVLWAYMDCAAIGDAHEALARREWGDGALPRDWPGWKNRNIATWTKAASATSAGAAAQRIATWANGKRLDGVVWTDLPPKFGGQESVPSCDQVISFLQQLQKSNKHAKAEEYIRNAPPQIQTKYRRAIESKFGWACNYLATQAEII